MVACAAGCAAFLTASCSQFGTPPSPGEPFSLPIRSGTPTLSLPPYATPTTSAQALADLALLAVRTGDTALPYRADLFASPRPDPVSKCDARDVVLKADLTDVALAPKSGCKVNSGVIFDPYTGRWRWFSHLAVLNQVDVVEVVSFSNAWESGAYGWRSGVFAAFAGDPVELQATAAEVVAMKGDKDAASWLPPNAAYRCGYVIAQITVKVKYVLSVTAAERDAMEAVLHSCPTNAVSPSPPGPPPPSPSLPATARPATHPPTPRQTGLRASSRKPSVSTII